MNGHEQDQHVEPQSRVEAIRRLWNPGLDLGRGDHLPWRWWARTLWRVLRPSTAEISHEPVRDPRDAPAADSRTATSAAASEGQPARAQRRRLGRSGLARGAESLRKNGTPARRPYNGDRGTP